MTTHALERRLIDPVWNLHIAEIRGTFPSFAVLTMHHSLSCHVPAVTKAFQLHQEFLELEQRMLLLDRLLTDARNRIRHSSSAEGVEKAREDERHLLAQLDRLLTRMRAIEGQLLQVRKEATLH